MENKNAKIYVASVKNVSSRLEHYGDVNIDNISLLKLIYKYSCYCSTYDQLQRMNTMVSQLQNSDPLICSEIQATRGADYVNVFQVVETSGVDSPNQPPTISNTSFTVTAEDDTFTFSENQIYNGYSDLEGTIPGDFTIASLPFIGTLTYAGVPVVIDTLYSVPGLLVYTRGSDESNSDSFTWTVFDKDTQLPFLERRDHIMKKFFFNFEKRHDDHMREDGQKHVLMMKCCAYNFNIKFQTTKIFN